MKMYTLDKQYKKQTSHRSKCIAFNKTANVTAAGNMNVHELFYLIGVILMFVFDLKHNVRDTDVDLSAFKHFSGLK